MADNLTLHWSTLSTISDLTIHNQNKAGVYVWGFNINDVFIPYYVGIANDIIPRLCEHISSLLSGKYTIFHRNSLANFKEYKYKDVLEDKSKGNIYNPNWPYSLKSFLENRKDLQTHIDFMVDNFTYSYAIVDSERLTRKDLNEIEKICINHFGKENLWNTRAGYSDRFPINHTGDIRVIDKLQTTD